MVRIGPEVDRRSFAQDSQRSDYLLRYLGFDSDQLARNRCTLVSWHNDQTMETMIEVRSEVEATTQFLTVSDEVLYQVERSFSRVLGQAFRQVATAAAALTPALSQFGRTVIEATSVAEQEWIRYEMREGVWGRDQAFGVDETIGGWNIEQSREGCNCVFCQEYRDQHRDPTAQENARALLLSCLTPAQQEEYQASQSFTVKVPSGNRYRIEPRKNYNVVGLSRKGRPQAEYCAGPVEDVPLEDQMLAQKLLLETDEAGFLAVANGRPAIGGYISFLERMGYR
jgi:hypothetical protein